MTRSVKLALVSTVFALGAFGNLRSQEVPGEDDGKCSGKEQVCEGTCSMTCNPKDSTECWMVCKLTSKT